MWKEDQRKWIIFYVLAIMIVLAFPPKLSLSNHVRMESLYGMNIFFLECCNLSEASAVKKLHRHHFQAIYVKSFEYTPSF